MGASRFVVVVLCLPAGLAVPAQGEEARARKVIERAIAAVGGEANLARYRAATTTASGTVYLPGRAVVCTARVVYQPPFQRRFAIDGSDFHMVTVVDGDRGWLQVNGKVTAMTKEQLREHREILHAEWVAGLVPLLRTKGYSLDMLDEAKIDGKSAVGVRVRHREHREVKLWFQEESGLLLKLEVMLREKGKRQRAEVLFRDYAKIGGVRRAREVTTRRDGKAVSTWVVVEFAGQPKKVADSAFGKP